MDKMLKHRPFLGIAQDFVVRNDMQCGSTIGPKLASGLGIRTVDVGAPQLSMHSIREMCGVDDVLHSYNHFKAFFEEFSLLDAKLSVDEAWDRKLLLSAYRLCVRHSKQFFLFFSPSSPNVWVKLHLLCKTLWRTLQIQAGNFPLFTFGM